MKPFAFFSSIQAALLLCGCAITQPRTASTVDGCCTPPPAQQRLPSASSAAAESLRTALADERRAHDWYESVMAKHGRLRPFSNIVHAEMRHAQLVEALMERYGVPIPKDRPAELPLVPDSFRECCTVAADLERANIDMYDALLARTAEPDIASGFRRLRAASLNNHLPAFERWAQ